MKDRKKRKRIWWLALLVPFTVLAAFAIRPDLPLAELEEKYANAESEFVVLEGTRVHYRDEGDPTRDALLLIHGSGASLHTWDDWVLELSDDFRIVRLDLPGHGLTGPTEDHDYQPDRVTDTILALLDHLGIERAHIAGNSYGGHLSFRIGALYPERVNRIILIDAAGIPKEGNPPLVFQLARTPVVSDVLKYATPRAFIRMNLEQVYANDDLVTPELVTRYHDLARRPGNRAAFVARARQGRTDESHLLPDVSAPTLILWGKEDRWIPVEDADRMAEMIPSAQVIIYDDLGHTPMEEAPLVTANHARIFLIGGE